MIVCSEEWAAKRGLEPLATILSQGYVADDFAYLARTPANAGAMALERAGKSIDDVQRVEINEAFASVAWNSTKLLGADEAQVNVNGGAVALGHPIGASGGRIVCDDGARAAALGRRPRPGRDLLRRRPGRRAPDRGLRRPASVRDPLRAAAVSCNATGACWSSTGRSTTTGPFRRGSSSGARPGRKPRVREVEEETSLRCTLGDVPAGRTTYPMREGQKEVRWFLMECDGEPRAQNEVDEVRWVTYDEAQELLSYDYDRELSSSLR